MDYAQRHYNAACGSQPGKQLAQSARPWQERAAARKGDLAALSCRTKKSRTGSPLTSVPKLRDRVVLEAAIRDAVAKLDPSFGYADRFDEAAGGYRNLVWAKNPPPWRNDND